MFLGFGERLGDAELALVEAGLLEPGYGPAGVGVEVSLLLGERLFQRLVDEREGVAHRERAATYIQHARVAAEDRHARADGGLGQVHGRDAAGLHGAEGGG